MTSTLQTYDNLSWLAVSMVSGKVIAELPYLQCSNIEMRMMEGTSLSATLPFDGLPVNWVAATEPMKISVLLVQEGNEYPLWGANIVQRDRELGGNAITLKLATYEDYLDRQIVGNDTYTQVLQTQIVGSLVQKWAIDGKNNALQLDIAPSGIRRDDTDHKLDDKKSVLSCIQALSKLRNGPEWYIDWQKKGMEYYPVFHVDDHIGSQTPITTFKVDNLSSFKITESWNSGDGATRVKAMSSADGDITPQSSWHDSYDNSRPVIDYVYTPSTSITNVATLESHAAAKLEAIRNGVTTVEMGFNLFNMPQLGVEWNLGDCVSWQLDSPDVMQGFTNGQARFIGYKIDLTSATLTPYLLSSGTGE